MRTRAFADRDSGLSDGNVRPLLPRSSSSLSQAEEENGQSRIYLGIHWAFDKTEGTVQGRRVADYVYSKTRSCRCLLDIASTFRGPNISEPAASRC